MFYISFSNFSPFYAEFQSRGAHSALSIQKATFLWWCSHDVLACKTNRRGERRIENRSECRWLKCDCEPWNFTWKGLCSEWFKGASTMPAIFLAFMSFLYHCASFFILIFRLRLLNGERADSTDQISIWRFGTLKFTPRASWAAGMGTRWGRADKAVKNVNFLSDDLCAH